MIFGSVGNSGDVFHGRGSVLLLRGLFAIVFAVLTVTLPSMTQDRLVGLFGVYALIHGLLSFIAAIAGRGQPGSVLLAIEGVVGLWAGLFALSSSLPTPFVSIVFIWSWAAGTGVLQIMEAIRLRGVSGALWLGLAGLVMLSFGFIVWLRPPIFLASIIARFALLWGDIRAF
jgi:uncharacterized membrane protein HdeD (DUF308 family)